MEVKNAYKTQTTVEANNLDVKDRDFGSSAPGYPLQDISPSQPESSTGEHAEPTEEPLSMEDENYVNPNRPRGLKFIILFVCILMGDFLSGYDTSCVETLSPVITDHFHATDDIGWYAIAYLLASCATLLIYGQLYTYFPMKQVYMGTLLVFIIGAIVSASAPTSPAFIVGRAISGLGSAGVFAGGSIIVANITSLRTRPIYQAMGGGMECIATAFGPVISGVIAEHSSWRVPFYIIIPIAASLLISVFFFVPKLPQPENANMANREKFQKLDFPGFAIYLPMTVCLVFGLQWAGIDYHWDNWRIILLLVLAGVLSLTFLGWEHKAGPNGMFPLDMLRSRSVSLSCLFTFATAAAMYIVAYYLPIYFQAIRGATTGESGIMILPYAISFAIAVLLAGPITTWIGYYTPVMVFGSALMAVATGLFTTLSPTTATGKWIGYQILYGVGIGLAFQQPYTAVQTVLPDEQVPIALVTLAFAQEFGAIVALSIAQNVFVDRLTTQLSSTVPGLDPKTVLESGTTGILSKVPVPLRAQVLRTYNGVIVDIFYIALALTCLTAVGAVGIEWKSVKEEKQESED